MSNQPNSFERKKNANGTPNQRYVDVLAEDKPIAGQKFVCLSFLSPEKILKQKETFFFQEFVKSWDFSKSMEKFGQFLNFLSYKYGLNYEDIMKDMEEFVRDQRDELVAAGNIENDFKNFMDKKEDKLQEQFDKENGFQTNVRGVKVRGSYPTQEEAEMRAKLLREQDPDNNIFVGMVGVYLPWDPEAYKTMRVEYLEEELNQLMHEKTKNETNARQNFEERVRTTKEKAIEENKKQAEKTGASVTQDILEDGTLVTRRPQDVDGDGGEAATVSEVIESVFH